MDWMNERGRKFNTVLFSMGKKVTQVFYPHTPKCRMASTMPLLAWLSAT